MDNRASRIRELFESAVELPRAARQTYLDANCDSGELAFEVSRMLEEHDSLPEGFLPDNDKTTPPEPAVERIGMHRVLRELGRGGMGVVYEAEQHSPQRIVAIKMLRPGFASADMLRRFAFEGDLLARLDHPAIARVYETGTDATTAGTRPFIVMERVAGQRLDQWIEQTAPPLEVKLKVLQAIAEAVSHAHLRGVIHRDLKPSNILITADGLPKVLDFGIARLSESSETAMGMMTVAGEFLGTLPYAAPEQAAGRLTDIDTRSDVYSLGVIFYQSLSGRMPYNVQGKPLHEAVATICTAEPPDLGRLDRHFAGDIATIVATALEKEKTRRYSTAGALADDIRRYRENEPITARPASALYQIRKFAARHKTLVGAAAAVLLLLVAGLVGTSSGLIQARRQKALALERSTEADTLNQYMLEMITSARPADSRGKPVAVQDILLSGLRQLDARLASQPVAAARLRDRFAYTLSELGQDAAALPEARRAADDLKRLKGADDPDALTAAANVGFVLENLGKSKEAVEADQAAYEAQKRVLGPENSQTLTTMSNLAVALDDAGRSKEALALDQSLLDIRRRVLPPDDPDTLMSMHNLAGALDRVGKPADAEALYRDCYQRQQRVLGKDHPQTLMTLTQWVPLLSIVNKSNEALPLVQQGHADALRVLGADHKITVNLLTKLAACEAAAGQHAQARGHWLSAWESSKRNEGADSKAALICQAKAAEELFDAGQREPALAELKQALEDHRRLLGDDDDATLNRINNLGNRLMTAERPDEALPCFKEVMERRCRINGEAAYSSVIAIGNYGFALHKLGRDHEAVPYLQQAVAGYEKTLGPSHPQVARSDLSLLVTLMADHQDAEALALSNRLLGEANNVGNDPRFQAAVQADHALCLLSVNQTAVAEPALESSLTALRSANLGSGTLAVRVIESLRDVHRQFGDADQTRRWEQELATVRAATKPATISAASKP